MIIKNIARIAKLPLWEKRLYLKKGLDERKVLFKSILIFGQNSAIWWKLRNLVEIGKIGGNCEILLKF